MQRVWRIRQGPSLTSTRSANQSSRIYSARTNSGVPTLKLRHEPSRSCGSREVLVRSAAGEGVSRRGFEKLEFKSQESELVQLIKPLFPFVRSWTLIDKCLTTLSMICVIRGLYFMPMYGIHPNKLPTSMNLNSPEQMMLQKIFMAEDSIPLNIAILGIAPIIASSYVIQLVLTIPVFGFIPGPFQGLLNKKRMGALTNSEIEKTSFGLALFVGTFMALHKAGAMNVFAAGVKFFLVTAVMDMLAALTITRFCCNIIQFHGFGEGTGFLLLALTLSGFGKRLWSVATSVQQGTVPLWKVGVVVVCYVGIIGLCTVLNETQIRLPLTNYGMRGEMVSPKRRGEIPMPEGRQGATQITSAPYFPLPISQTAISALFLSSGFCWFLTSFLQRWPAIATLVQREFGQMLMVATSAFFLALIPIGQNASNLSEYLAGVYLYNLILHQIFLCQMEMGIKGFIPGDQTVRHLRSKIFQSQLMGAFFLFLIIVCCMSLDLLCSRWLGTAIGTLNLVLLVSVISSAFKTMETHMEAVRMERVMQKEKDVIQLIRKGKD